MTDNVLAQFFANDAIESKFSLSEVAKRAEQNFGFDIHNIYCLHTGKPIGRLFNEELEFALNDEASDDLDDLADAMAVRIVASMRPSPALNKPDAMTLQAYAARNPVDIMAYLVNRLHGSRDLLVKRNGTNSFQPLMQRITDYRRWQDMAAKGFDFKPWIHWLLELEVKMNLHDLKSPLVRQSRKGNWVSSTMDGESVFNALSIESNDQVFEVFQAWVFQQLGVYEDRYDAATKQQAWFRGNRMAATAYTRSWLDNPQIARRATDSQPKNQPKSVGRPKTEATKKKDSKVSNALALLDGILGTVQASEPSAPKPVTLPKLKLNLAKFKKSESN